MYKLVTLIVTFTIFISLSTVKTNYIRNVDDSSVEETTAAFTEFVSTTAAINTTVDATTAQSSGNVTQEQVVEEREIQWGDRHRSTGDGATGDDGRGVNADGEGVQGGFGHSSHSFGGNVQGKDENNWLQQQQQQLQQPQQQQPQQQGESGTSSGSDQRNDDLGNSGFQSRSISQHYRHNRFQSRHRNLEGRPY